MLQTSKNIRAAMLITMATAFILGGCHSSRELKASDMQPVKPKVAGVKPPMQRGRVD